MFKKILTLVLLVTGYWLLVTSAYAQQEEKLSITTYYPSPYGSYNELRSKRMAIGDNYYTYYWGSGQGVNCISPDVDLAVEGEVNFGGVPCFTFPADKAFIEMGPHNVFNMENKPTLYVGHETRRIPAPASETSSAAIVANSIYGSAIVAVTGSSTLSTIPASKMNDVPYILDNLSAGVKGKSTAEGGIGVAGTTKEYKSIGVGGSAEHSLSYGVLGYSRNYIGVFGRTNTDICQGIGQGWIDCIKSGGAPFELYAGKIGAGVVGYAEPSIGKLGLGVYGFSFSNQSIGVGGYTYTDDSTSVVGYNSQGGTGVHGYSISGIGVVGQSQTGYGVYAVTNTATLQSIRGDNLIGTAIHGETGDGTGVYGHSSSKIGKGTGVYGDSDTGNGVYGHSGTEGIGVYGASERGIGVYGLAKNPASWAGYFKGSVYVLGDIVIGGSITGADVAEDMECSDCHAGDVVVIDSNHNQRLKKSHQAYDSTVAGVISEKPNLHIGGSDSEIAKPLALVGQVKCKVTTENGPIKRGDLLVTSSKAGYAMRADIDKLKPGMLVGKALEPLEKDEGKITVLITGG